MNRLPFYKGTSLAGWAIVDEEDYDELIVFLWRAHSNTGYVCRHAEGTTVLMHRQILGLQPGDGIESDHINGNRLDNRRQNLRPGSRAENMQNVPSRPGSSRFRGVYRHRDKWVAQAKVAQVHHYLGIFATEEEAGRVAAAFRAEHLPFSNPDRQEIAA